MATPPSGAVGSGGDEDRKPMDQTGHINLKVKGQVKKKKLCLLVLFLFPSF